MSETTRAAMWAGKLRAAKPIEARFWPKVDKSAGAAACWPFTGSVGSDGYGRFAYHGKVKHAHRVAMLLLGHDVPAHMDVDHCGCRLRKCCNPAHLRVATKRQNALENNDSPLAKNAQATTCKFGHPWTPENIYMATVKNAKNRHGKRVGPKSFRQCLTCYRARHPRTKR